MASKLDLHMHTIFSDGKLSVEQLFDLVQKQKVDIMALTDHDTVRGLMHISKNNLKRNFQFVNGVEMSTGTQEENEVHIVGYFPQDSDLEAIQKDIDSKQTILRYERELQMVKNLNKGGIQIEWSRVLELANGANPSRPIIAMALIEKGYVQDKNEAFAKYIGNNCPYYFNGEKLSPEEGIQLIHKYGGLASWAHPWYCVNPEKLLLDLVSYHIDGMESFPPSCHQEYNTDRYINLCKEQHLIPTSGSDFHEMTNEGRYVLPGDNCFPYMYHDQIIQAFKEKKII
ncbi:hypothetical protein WA158_005427 [Blastocystis sp. Blastoise]